MDATVTRPQQTFELGPEDEFRFEVGSGSIQVQVRHCAADCQAALLNDPTFSNAFAGRQLLNGTAEICGSELARGALSKMHEYSFANYTGYVRCHSSFVWHTFGRLSDRTVGVDSDCVDAIGIFLHGKAVASSWKVLASVILCATCGCAQC